MTHRNGAIQAATSTPARRLVAAGIKRGASPLITIARVDLDAMDAEQRDSIRWWASLYLRMADRHSDTYATYGRPFLDALGIADRHPYRYDEDLLVALARQVIAALDAKVDALTAAADVAQDAAGIAVAWVVAGMSDADRAAASHVRPARPAVA